MGGAQQLVFATSFALVLPSFQQNTGGTKQLTVTAAQQSPAKITKWLVRNGTCLHLTHLVLFNKPHQRDQPTTQSFDTKIKVESYIYFPL